MGLHMTLLLTRQCGWGLTSGTEGAEPLNTVWPGHMDKSQTQLVHMLPDPDACSGLTDKPPLWSVLERPLGAAWCCVLLPWCSSHAP